jgi:flagellar protein FlaG
MDISNIDTTISPPDAIKPTTTLNIDKDAADTKSSKSIQIQPTEDKQENNFNVEDIEELSKELNNYMDDFQTNLGFSIHEELDNQVIVEIRDRKTGELIRQIPSEELLSIREKMAELTGLLFDQRI